MNVNGASRAPRSPVVRRSAGRRRVTRGRGGLFASAYPRMGSSIYLALGLVAIHGLGLTPVALLVAGLVFAAVAACYAEGVSMFPEAGGSASFAREGFNELASFLTGWAMCLALIAITALAALFVPHYLSVFWAPLATKPWDVVGGLVVIGVVAAVNVRGLEPPAGVSAFLGLVDLIVQALLVVLGALFVFSPDQIRQNVHFGTAPSLEQLILACAVAMIAYTGIDTIGEMAGEARDPDRDLPRATTGVLGSAVTLSVALSLIAMMAMPVFRGASGAYTTRLVQGPPHGDVAYPVLGIVSRLPLHVFSNGLGYIVGLLVAVMLLVTAHAAVTSLSRLSYWLTQHHQLPARAAELHPSYETPYVAIACATVAAAALVILQAGVGGASFLAGTYVYGALLAFTSVQVSIVAMRWRDPARYRPFEVPVNIPVDGRRIPVLAIVGALATAAAWIAVILLEPGPRYLGSAWILIGLAGYAAYRRRRGLTLTEYTRRDLSQHGEPGIAVAFQTILIPVNTDQADLPADVVEVAAHLAAERRPSLVLLAFTQIPLSEEMDMEIDDLDANVERLAAQARAIGEQYGIRVHTTHLRTRDPADSILAEATRRDSQVILLRATSLDRIARRIVAEAKQRVMIVQPERARA
jgi:basic amino acid/polyamine antiporter, APA family